MAVIQAYQFREVRKSECGDVLMYASMHGFDLEGGKLKHHLSLLAIDGDKQIIAAALCLVDTDGRLVIKVLSEQSEELEQISQELTNRCLRKVQAETFSSARITSPSAQPAEGVLTKASWLDKIQETAPADDNAGSEDGPEAEQSPQAA